MADNCYICLGETGVLVRPCTNEKCNARVHENCLAKQVENNNKRCGNCREQILIKTIRTNFDFEVFIKTIYPIILVHTIGYYGPIQLHVFTLTNNQFSFATFINCCVILISGIAVMIFVGLIALIIDNFISSLQKYIHDNYYKTKMKYGINVNKK